MILLHLFIDDKSVLLHPKYITYVEQYTNTTSVTYTVGEKERVIVVKETPEEIQQLINIFYIPF